MVTFNMVTITFNKISGARNISSSSNKSLPPNILNFPDFFQIFIITQDNRNGLYSIVDYKGKVHKKKNRKEKTKISRFG